MLSLAAVVLLLSGTCVLIAGGGILLLGLTGGILLGLGFAAAKCSYLEYKERRRE